MWCHGCGRHAHVGCVKKKPLPRGPWHCGKCRGKFRREGRRDVTLDVALLAFLVGDVLPGDVGEQRRVVRASRFVRVDASGSVWVVAEQDGWERRVPPIAMR